jgi:NitT/TauT family transport system substrate-binding protein
VAGGPVDKSFLVLQALYAQKTGRSLTRDATITYGAPPLVNEELLGRRADASLNFWHFNARASLSGAHYLVTVPEMLKDLGIARTPPLLGWVFSEGFAARHPETIKAFLDASFATKQALLTDDSIWVRIRPVMNAPDDALFIALRDAYRAGIVTSYTDADIDAAKATYALIARYGGAELAGDSPGLAAGTFWAGYRN